MDVEQKGDGATQGERVVDPGDEAAAAKLWAVYISEAEKYDKGLVESWKSDMQGMLIFAGLFSASLTAFLIESYKTLNIDSGDATVQLLSRISQQLEGSANGSTLPIPSPSSFAPTAASIICNALWFISLGLSLTCALVATLLDQWARDFLHRSEIRSAPLIRARIFSYLYYGLKRFNMHTVVEIIPLLLHASLFLFLSGLVAFLIPISRIMTIIAGLILLTVVVTYSVLTLLPLQYFDCPYRTPLSGGFWRLFRSYQRIWAQSTSKSTLCDETMVETMAHRAVEDSAERTIRDGRALVWTVKSLSDDSELEPFVEGIPDVLWGLTALDYPVPVFWGSGGPQYGQRYSYADHVRELIKNPDVQLCDRIESHLQSSDTGLLSPDARKRRLIASYKALWAIATLFHPKQFPMQSPLDFSHWKRVFEPEYDPDTIHYSLSAQALMRWSSFNANESRVIEFSQYLAGCRTDIEQGIEPDKLPITSFLINFPWWHPLGLHIHPVPEGKLTIYQISIMQSAIDTAQCNVRFNYLERASGLDSKPHLWLEILQLLELPWFDFSKCGWRLEQVINSIVHILLEKDNTEKLRWQWIDRVVHDLFRLWSPVGSAVIPFGIIRYLNEQTEIDHSFWFDCAGRLLSNFPTTLSTLRLGTASVATEDQTLTALWRVTSRFPFSDMDWAVYSSVLEALVNSSVSAISISVTFLVKAKLYGSLGWAVTEENWLSHFNHPLLPTETAVTTEPESVTTITTDYYISPIERNMGI
ncbi:hypothetical protein MVEN_01865300 [Mycena venus]|uniref:DUF6535 domain-containing protein n=1 Tax=Mycena venus TaxID=2733690 RepID=A0A8H7CME3_9AGAR|nr:hypothetical protein MVEN_01865300 [Mycena venus]